MVYGKFDYHTIHGLDCENEAPAPSIEWQRTSRGKLNQFYSLLSSHQVVYELRKITHLRLCLDRDHQILLKLSLCLEADILGHVLA